MKRSRLNERAVTDGKPRISTDAFAAQYMVEADSVRKRYSQTGSYHGIRPLVLPNRRLLWPADSLEKLAADQLQTAH